MLRRHAPGRDPPRRSLRICLRRYRGSGSSRSGPLKVPDNSLATVPTVAIEAILFDMNGVLVDDEDLHLAAFQGVLRRRGYDLTSEDYARHFAGRTDRDGFRSFFQAVDGQSPAPDVESALMTDKAEAYRQLASERLVTYPNAQTVVEKLRESGFRLALVTSSLAAEADVVLVHLGLEHAFEARVTAEDVTDGKPAPEPYVRGAAAIHTAPKRCVVIEDAPSGIRSAREAGIKSIAVRTTHSPEELSEADVQVDGLADLVPDLIRSLGCD